MHSNLQVLLFPWMKVLSLEEINGEKGQFDGTWPSLADENVYETEAKSRYFVENFKKYAWSPEEPAYINGEIVVASWSDKQNGIPDSLSYTKSGIFLAEDGGTVKVKSLECSSSGDDTLAPVSIPVNRTVDGGGSEEWGQALKCDNGPEVVDSDAGTSQPAILLTRGGAGDTEGDKYIIVEETSRYPSFLYSVWYAAGVTDSEDQVEITYTFHIASAVRLAEAVVTGIVNGFTDGAGCFGLLRAYSRGPDTIDFGQKYGTLKANPFGENPEGGTVDSLQDVETIEAGLDVNVIAMICFVCLMVLSFIGISWSLLLRKRTGMDIYDRCAFCFVRVEERSKGLRPVRCADGPVSHGAYIGQRGRGTVRSS